MNRIILISTTWCGPCKALKQKWYDPLHEEFPEQTECIYADLDVTTANRVLGAPVRSVPTVIFRGNEMEDICRGAKQIWTLEEARKWLSSK